MDLNFTYSCISCGETKVNKDMESFRCDCGGHFRLSDSINTDVFDPYFDETLGVRIHSASQRDKEFKKAGLYVSQDDKKMIKRWSDQRKYKEDIAQETFRKEGKWYKPGSGKEWSDERKDFVKGSSKYVRKYF